MLIKSVITLALATLSFESMAAASISSNGIHINGINIDGNGIEIPTGSSGAISTSSQTSVGGGQGVINTDGAIACTAKVPKAGVNRNVQVTGNCQSISVNGTNLTINANQAATLTEMGTNNEIHINKVNSITLKGTNATVIYKSSFNGGEPVRNIRGVNASIQRVR